MTHEAFPRFPIQAGQDAFAGQDRDRHDPLALGGHHRERQYGRAQSDAGVDVQVVSGQADHGRDQGGESWATGVRGVVIDVSGGGGEQRVGTCRVIAPALTSE